MKIDKDFWCNNYAFMPIYFLIAWIKILSVPTLMAIGAGSIIYFLWNILF